MQIKEEITSFSSQNEYFWLNEMRVCISKTFLAFLDVINKKINLELHIESQKVMKRSNIFIKQTLYLRNEKMVELYLIFDKRNYRLKNKFNNWSKLSNGSYKL